MVRRRPDGKYFREERKKHGIKNHVLRGPSGVWIQNSKEQETYLKCKLG